MLVLSRKIGERIFIEPGIEIAIVDVRGGRVSIGVAAPDDIRIRRVGSPQESGYQIRRSAADLLTASPRGAE
jgi:carbon storage regulator CsrA